MGNGTKVSRRAGGESEKERASAVADARKDDYSALSALPIATAEEVEDDAGGDPIVVLVKAGAESGPVVVDVD